MSDGGYPGGAGYCWFLTGRSDVVVRLNPTKLLENIFRSVNIALVNEVKVIYSAMAIDIWEVIGAAKTKPFGFMPLIPALVLADVVFRSILFI